MENPASQIYMHGRNVHRMSAEVILPFAIPSSCPVLPDLSKIRGAVDNRSLPITEAQMT
jgi:hypothetical protein